MSQQENYNEAATRSQETFLLALIKILFDNWAFVGFDVTSVNRHESAKDLQRSNGEVTSNTSSGSCLTIDLFVGFETAAEGLNRFILQ